jgi:hypothetical protein
MKWENKRTQSRSQPAARQKKKKKLRLSLSLSLPGPHHPRMLFAALKKRLTKPRPNESCGLWEPMTQHTSNPIVPIAFAAPGCYVLTRARNRQGPCPAEPTSARARKRMIDCRATGSVGTDLRSDFFLFVSRRMDDKDDAGLLKQRLNMGCCCMPQHQRFLFPIGAFLPLG